jgi:hypothetical protein
LHQSGANACLAGNQDVATQSYEVGRKILVDPHRPKVIERYRLEQGAVLAESARRLRDDHDVFRTVPLDDIQSNIAAAVDCVEGAGDGRNSIREVLVGHPDLAAKGAEAARHYS